MLEPRRAPVRPRVVSPVSGETLLLEGEILSLLERGESGVVWLVGGPGAGKTAALAHLAAVIPPSDRLLLHDYNWAGRHEWGKLEIGCGIAGTAPRDAFLVYELAPWTDDEIIEYLLAVHRERCPSVVRRCKEAGDATFLRGIPELWRHVLDVLAADENVATPKAALRRVIASRLPDGIARELARSWCLAVILGQAEIAAAYRAQLEKVCDFPHLLRLLWHVPVLLLLAAEGIADQLNSGESFDFLKYPLPRELVEQVALTIRENERALDRLKGLIAARRRVLHPMAASLLHATKTGWRPEPVPRSGLRHFLSRKFLSASKTSVPQLIGAYLEEAEWPGIALARVQLADADLVGADLRNADLNCGDAKRANLQGASFSGASLQQFCADYANLSVADFSYVRAESSSFDSADAEGASFEGALLKGASFRDAKLTNASFVRANLSGAALTNAEIEGADFSQAELAGAWLAGLALRLAEFRQCNFQRAEMSDCDLEGMTLPGGGFQHANLMRALLTGTVMPRADFRGATLVNTGLADIDWEQSDLRDADLRGASFHMGSSRSGLVDSPIASYGSRTGFYTDDYNEQDFKPPEEIRKANLRGADLRGAKIEGVDFYLVDLRDARYDARQEQHFRSCGAILESRVP
ncbi:MAG: pentapeptide repeat-containing protein [Deltaproteobacteria bacterium]